MWIYRTKVRVDANGVTQENLIISARALTPTSSVSLVLVTWEEFKTYVSHATLF